MCHAPFLNFEKNALFLLFEIMIGNINANFLSGAAIFKIVIDF